LDSKTLSETAVSCSKSIDGKLSEIESMAKANSSVLDATRVHASFPLLTADDAMVKLGALVALGRLMDNCPIEVNNRLSAIGSLEQKIASIRQDILRGLDVGNAGIAIAAQLAHAERCCPEATFYQVFSVMGHLQVVLWIIAEMEVTVE